MYSGDKKMVHTFFHSIIATGSVILALIGLYLVAMIWPKWKKMEMDVIKARVFLNKKFLERNWLYVFLSGGALALHQLLEVLIGMDYIQHDSWISELSGSLEFIVLLLLVTLAFEWYRILHTGNKITGK